MQLFGRGDIMTFPRGRAAGFPSRLWGLSPGSVTCQLVPGAFHIQESPGAGLRGWLRASSSPARSTFRKAPELDSGDGYFVSGDGRVFKGALIASLQSLARLES